VRRPRGGEIAAQVLNPTQPMNELIRRAMTNTDNRLRADSRELAPDITSCAAEIEARRRIGWKR
jgi:hypothetical protein